MSTGNLLAYNKPKSKSPEPERSSLQASSSQRLKIDGEGEPKNVVYYPVKIPKEKFVRKNFGSSDRGSPEYAKVPSTSEASPFLKRRSSGSNQSKQIYKQRNSTPSNFNQNPYFTNPNPNQSLNPSTSQIKGQKSKSIQSILQSFRHSQNALFEVSETNTSQEQDLSKIQEMSPSIISRKSLSSRSDSTSRQRLIQEIGVFQYKKKPKKRDPKKANFLNSLDSFKNRRRGGSRGSKFDGSKVSVSYGVCSQSISDLKSQLKSDYTSIKDESCEGEFKVGKYFVPMDSKNVSDPFESSNRSGSVGRRTELRNYDNTKQTGNVQNQREKSIREKSENRGSIGIQRSSMGSGYFASEAGKKSLVEGQRPSQNEGEIGDLSTERSAGQQGLSKYLASKKTQAQNPGYYTTPRTKTKMVKDKEVNKEGSAVSLGIGVKENVSPHKKPNRARIFHDGPEVMDKQISLLLGKLDKVQKEEQNLLQKIQIIKFLGNNFQSHNFRSFLPEYVDKLRKKKGNLEGQKSRQKSEFGKLERRIIEQKNIREKKRKIVELLEAKENLYFQYDNEILDMAEQIQSLRRHINDSKDALSIKRHKMIQKVESDVRSRCELKAMEVAYRKAPCWDDEVRELKLKVDYLLEKKEEMVRRNRARGEGRTVFGYTDLEF